MDPKKAFAEAKPAALKAVALDEEFGEGHATLGLLRLLDDWDWQTADAETRRTIELAPGNPYVYVYVRGSPFPAQPGRLSIRLFQTLSATSYPVSLGVNSVRCNCRFKTWTEAALRFPAESHTTGQTDFPLPLMIGHLSTLVLTNGTKHSLGWNKHMNSATHRWHG